MRRVPCGDPWHGEHTTAAGVGSVVAVAVVGEASRHGELRRRYARLDGDCITLATAITSLVVQSMKPSVFRPLRLTFEMSFVDSMVSSHSARAPRPWMGNVGEIRRRARGLYRRLQPGLRGRRREEPRGPLSRGRARLGEGEEPELLAARFRARGSRPLEGASGANSRLNLTQRREDAGSPVAGKRGRAAAKRRPLYRSSPPCGEAFARPSPDARRPARR